MIDYIIWLFICEWEKIAHFYSILEITLEMNHYSFDIILIMIRCHIGWFQCSYYVSYISGYQLSSSSGRDDQPLWNSGQHQCSGVHPCLLLIFKRRFFLTMGSSLFHLNMFEYLSTILVVKKSMFRIHGCLESFDVMDVYESFRFRNISIMIAASSDNFWSSFLW